MKFNKVKSHLKCSWETLKEELSGSSHISLYIPGQEEAYFTTLAGKRKIFFLEQQQPSQWELQLLNQWATVSTWTVHHWTSTSGLSVQSSLSQLCPHPFFLFPIKLNIPLLCCLNWPTVCHSLHVMNYNSSVISKLILLVK